MGVCHCVQFIPIKKQNCCVETTNCRALCAVLRLRGNVESEARLPPGRAHTHLGTAGDSRRGSGGGEGVGGPGREWRGPAAQAFPRGPALAGPATVPRCLGMPHCVVIRSLPQAAVQGHLAGLSDCAGRFFWSGPGQFHDPQRCPLGLAAWAIP